MKILFIIILLFACCDNDPVYTTKEETGITVCETDGMSCCTTGNIGEYCENNEDTRCTGNIKQTCVENKWECTMVCDGICAPCSLSEACCYLGF